MCRCTVLTVTECLIYSDITTVVEGNLHVSIQSDNRDLAEFSFQHFQICPNFFVCLFLFCLSLWNIKRVGALITTLPSSTSAQYSKLETSNCFLPTANKGSVCSFFSWWQARLAGSSPSTPSHHQKMLLSYKVKWHFEKESGKASARLKHSVNCFIYPCEVLSFLSSRDLQVKEWALHACGLHASISCMYACVCGCVCVSTCLCECICVTILGMYKYAWMWFNRMHAWLEDVHMTIHMCLVTTAHVQCLPCRKGLQNCKQCKSHPPSILKHLTSIWPEKGGCAFQHTAVTPNKDSGGCHSSVITNKQERR